jgi:hypothetical protein
VKSIAIGVTFGDNALRAIIAIALAVDGLPTMP